MSDQTPDDARDAARRKRDEDIGRAAAGLGGALGRLARKASQAARDAAETARPEAERLARRTAEQARAAARAAKPHAEQAARDAKRYLEEHDDDLKRAGRAGARIMANRAVPLPIRPFVDAMGRELHRPPAPLVDQEPKQEPSLDADAPQD